jgi:hypothetical protein
MRWTKWLSCSLAAGAMLLLVGAAFHLSTDRIELHAGLLTPAVWLFAFMFYRYRHRRWRRLIAEVC